MLNFTSLAQASVGHRTWWRGLLPPLATIVTLLAVSLAIAGGMWLWSAFWVGAFAQTVGFMPLLGGSILGVVGMAFLNFWFSREINTFMLSSREECEGFEFDEYNPTNLRQMVKHLVAEVNARGAKKYGDKHKPIPLPRILTHTDHHFKVQGVGRNPGKTGLFFSSHVTNSHDTGMNQKHIAALTEKEILKIYERYNFGHFGAGMISDLASTLNNLNSGNLFFRILGFLAGPLHFLLLLEKAINRTHEHAVTRMVAEDCHRGPDLIDAMDLLANPTMFKKRTFARLKADKDQRQREQRPPYQGIFARWLRPFTDWIDGLELAGDDRTGWRILSLLDSLVREGGYYIKELFGAARITTLKGTARQYIPGFNQAMTDEDIEIIRQREKALNNELYQLIPLEDRYEPISPNGTGYVNPAEHHNHPHEHADGLYRQIREMQAEIALMKRAQGRQDHPPAGLPQAPALRLVERLHGHGHGHGHDHDEHDHHHEEENQRRASPMH